VGIGVHRVLTGIAVLVAPFINVLAATMALMPRKVGYPFGPATILPAIEYLPFLGCSDLSYAVFLI
jgi:hypothetical protein